MLSLALAVSEPAELPRALVGACVQSCTCEHRCFFGLSWAKNTREVCTDPTAASGGHPVLPRLPGVAWQTLFSPAQLGPAVVHSSRGVQGARAACPVLTLCLLPAEGLICGSEMKKLACASRARLSLQDGFCLKSFDFQQVCSACVSK